jgi:hypothetical protein
VKVVTQKIFVYKLIIYESMLFCWEWIILKPSARILWCDIHAISHRKSIEDVNMWFGGWWHGVQWMVTWHIVDDDVECLHVERNPTMTCSGSHLYKFYRWDIWKHVILLRVNHSKIISKNFVVWYTCYKPQKINWRHKYVIWWMMTWRIVDGDMTHSGWWCGMLACWEKSNHDL